MSTVAAQLKGLIGELSPAGKLAAFGLCLLAGLLLVTGGGMLGSRIAAARYDRREAERMKQVQAALSAAEAATRRAEAKEARAALLAEQNAARAGKTTAAEQQLQKEIAENETRISEAYRADVARINSNASLCERCRDTCSRLARAARDSPELAPFTCGPDSCAELCPSESNQ